MRFSSRVVSVTPEVLKGQPLPLIGVIGVPPVCDPEEEAARASQDGDAEVGRLGDSRYLDRVLGPVGLGLLAGCGLVAHRPAAVPQGALGADVIPEHLAPALVTHEPELFKDHLRVPYPRGQLGVYELLDVNGQVKINISWLLTIFSPPLLATSAFLDRMILG